MVPNEMRAVIAGGVVILIGIYLLVSGLIAWDGATLWKVSLGIVVLAIGVLNVRGGLTEVERGDRIREARKRRRRQ